MTFEDTKIIILVVHNHNSNNKKVEQCLYFIESRTDAFLCNTEEWYFFAQYQDFVMRGVRGILSCSGFVFE